MKPKKKTVELLVSVEIEYSTKRALADAVEMAKFDVLQMSTSSAGSRGWYSTKPRVAIVQEQP